VLSGNRLLLHLLPRPRTLARFARSRLGASRLVLTRFARSLFGPQTRRCAPRSLYYRYHVYSGNRLLLHLLPRQRTLARSRLGVSALRASVSLASLVRCSALRASDSALRASLLVRLLNFITGIMYIQAIICYFTCSLARVSVPSLAPVRALCASLLTRFARSLFGPLGLRLGAARLASRLFVEFHYRYHVYSGNHMLLHLLLRPRTLARFARSRLGATRLVLTRFARSPFGPSGLRLGAARLDLLYRLHILLGKHLQLHLLPRPRTLARFAPRSYSLRSFAVRPFGPQTRRCAPRFSFVCRISLQVSCIFRQSSATSLAPSPEYSRSLRSLASRSHSLVRASAL